MLRDCACGVFSELCVLADERAFKFQSVISGAQDPTFDGILGMTFCKRMA
jgi:hypothetical protein